MESRFNLKKKKKKKKISSRTITTFCCSVRPMFSVMCGLSCSLFMVVSCSMFLCCFCLLQQTFILLFILPYF